MTLVEISDKSLDYPQLDPSILLVFEVTALLSCTLIVAMCVCCYRNNQKERSHDNTYLDDLLSKPSLADPESVFSEAGFSMHTKSFYSSTGERSSFPVESACLQVPGYDSKEQTISCGTTIANNVLDQGREVEHINRSSFQREEDDRKFLET